MIPSIENPPLVYMRSRGDGKTPDKQYLAEIVTVSSDGTAQIWPLSLRQVLNMTIIGLGEMNRNGVISDE